MITRIVVFAVAIITALPATTGTRASAATIDFEFDVLLQTGALAGTQFTGTASYDNSRSTGVGIEYLGLTSLDFSLLGYQFTLANLDQGGEVVLDNGALSYFLVAFFPDAPAPVDDFAIGFGGPGVVGYSTPPGFNYGSGIEMVVPEPSSMCLGLIAIILVAATTDGS